MDTALFWTTWGRRELRKKKEKATGRSFSTLHFKKKFLTGDQSFSTLWESRLSLEIKIEISPQWFNWVNPLSKSGETVEWNSEELCSGMLFIINVSFVISNPWNSFNRNQPVLAVAALQYNRRRLKKTSNVCYDKWLALMLQPKSQTHTANLPRPHQTGSHELSQPELHYRNSIVLLIGNSLAKYLLQGFCFTRWARGINPKDLGNIPASWAIFLQVKSFLVWICMI